MDENEIIAKYGQPGTNQAYLILPYPMKLSWSKDTTIKRFQCHKLIVEPLGQIFKETLDVYGQTHVTELGLDVFGGCLNVRPMRNGSKPSVHSWGLAIDLDPERNTLNAGRNSVEFSKPEYEGFWDIVKKHGAYSLGQTKNYDWMHFQFVPID